VRGGRIRLPRELERRGGAAEGGVGGRAGDVVVRDGEEGLFESATDEWRRLVERTARVESGMDWRGSEHWSGRHGELDVSG
jgi:hypothetical protein